MYYSYLDRLPPPGLRTPISKWPNRPGPTAPPRTRGCSRRWGRRRSKRRRTCMGYIEKERAVPPTKKSLSQTLTSFSQKGEYFFKKYCSLRTRSSPPRLAPLGTGTPLGRPPPGRQGSGSGSCLGTCSPVFRKLKLNLNLKNMLQAYMGSSWPLITLP